MRGILFGIAAAALLFAALMDLKYCQVYRFVWWICGGAGVCLLGLQGGLQAAGGELPGRLAEWGFFCLLQQCWFSRKYGRADCHAFCCCSLLLCGRGGGMREYLLHMLYSFVFLGVVQAFGRNIDRKGNLKKTVPFIPYIAAAFFLKWAMAGSVY